MSTLAPTATVRSRSLRNPVLPLNIMLWFLKHLSHGLGWISSGVARSPSYALCWTPILSSRVSVPRLNMVRIAVVAGDLTGEHLEIPSPSYNADFLIC